MASSSSRGRHGEEIRNFGQNIYPLSHIRHISRTKINRDHQCIPGLIVYIATNIYHLACCFQSSPKRKIYQVLTLREIEYLEYIKTRDLAQYGDILRELQHFRKSGNVEDYQVVVELEKYISSLSGRR